ncbi:hypothetical protein AN1552.2 [Aspergillus nidulans FGSC A4]|uniref:Uncharacterized protein n=1 Tax=Emericella nidulans (strain FGSC A4 / ATCC 38163 / CBS 112.46 / NRRL 194 / M139) TaxID=227321 RepID=Q5BD28_EMENI|nr:hypothetical protein [Aspergillus nidulans FGSC A4]EAA64259.1 hypothetical protein AN1552.2 [Aspergillus nidulans FGSC A4]CBF85095.1 TPA: conserved hypothetical protein [Aspergillus nidulans FGSC A4]|eukprot:XP_659156.1 hypothetical protein AN1552.2 [Aspergillus nidulans FGSC A4]
MTRSELCPTFIPLFLPRIAAHYNQPDGFRLQTSTLVREFDQEKGAAGDSAWKLASIHPAGIRLIMRLIHLRFQSYRARIVQPHMDSALPPVNQLYDFNMPRQNREKLSVLCYMASEPMEDTEWPRLRTATAISSPKEVGEESTNTTGKRCKPPSQVRKRNNAPEEALS